MAMAESLPSEGVEGASVGTSLLSRPAEEFGNDPNLETAWALKAIEHMEVYFNLLCSVDPRFLRLTPHDDVIYKEFREAFPDFAISVLCENSIKSEESKTKWRPFCNKFANIVEDYNFGTLVRIDSSDEYSDKNSILVPRIQFYAIEIARNREGCNDGIRTKFKPAARAKESTQNANRCWVTKITMHIESVFESFCHRCCLSPVTIKPFIRKESRSKHKGDFCVFLGSPQMKQFLPYINEILHQLTSDRSRNWRFLDNIIGSDNFIQLTLDRSSIFREVLSEVAKMKEHYGSNDSGQGLSALISVCSNNASLEKSIAYLKSEAVAQHLASILQYNGFQVFLATDAPPRRRPVNPVDIQHIFCSEACNTDELYQVLLKLAKESRWRKDPSDEMKHERKAVHEISTMDSYEDIILDSREYLKEKSKFPNYKAYFKKMGNIYVQTNDVTESFKRAVQLEHMVVDHMPTIPQWIIHVGPECKTHFMQSSGLLFEMLTEKKPCVQQIYINAHLSGNPKNQLEDDADIILGKVRNHMETALIHKYGPEVLNEEMWIPCIDTLTETAFKFELFANASFPSKTLYEDEDKSKNQEKKRGTFVQYNCARLCRLFKRHEELVNKGRYSKLLEVEEVNFSLLKLQEEWNLFFNYVLPFPTLVKSFYEDMFQSHTAQVRCPSHEVCHMLMSLSQELSVYYNRTRVLVEAVPHLEKTMAARIWLLRAVHQVMKNALSLLGVEALEKM